MITERKITPTKKMNFRKLLFALPVNSFMIVFPFATNRRWNPERSVATDAKYAYKS